VKSEVLQIWYLQFSDTLAGHYLHATIMRSAQLTSK